MASKYSATDKDIFIQIIGKYPIIENKKTDTYNNQKKKTAWEKILAEYNDIASEKRTVIQLKRLWDKTKRTRKSALANERRELMATHGGSSKPLPSPQLEMEDIPHLEFKIDIDSKINSHESAEAFVDQEETPGSSCALDTKIPNIKRAVVRRPKNRKNHLLTALTQARLRLIGRKEEQIEELHKVHMEEAIYKREAARLIMLQEEAKLKKI